MYLQERRVDSCVTRVHVPSKHNQGGEEGGGGNKHNARLYGLSKHNHCGDRRAVDGQGNEAHHVPKRGKAALRKKEVGMPYEHLGRACGTVLMDGRTAFISVYEHLRSE